LKNLPAKKLSRGGKKLFKKIYYKKMTTAEKIKEITRKHLKNGGVALGQCLTAVGWVGGTVPELREEDGLIELATSDSSNSGIAVGLALAGRRPIYIIRYQGFQWYNAVSVVNYAAKSKELWGIPCPVFVRSIGMDGAVGPVAGGSHHSIFARMPGIPVCAPMTPCEYERAWDYFISHDDPLCVSEHRESFSINYEMPDIINEKGADITLLAISSTRLNALKAKEILEKEKITCNIINIFWLKPFNITKSMLKALDSSKYGGIVIDGDYEGGVMKTIAFDISQKTKSPIKVLGFEEKTAGFAPNLDNIPPSSEKICEHVRKIIKGSVK
jgi:acetoin:2,6-dichlorophenolindophenol oxidoreductase subunit beta